MIKKLLNSPIKILAFFVISFGILLLLVVKYLNSMFPWLCLSLAGGFGLYGIDYLIDKYCTRKDRYWLWQVSTLFVVSLGISLLYFYNHERTSIEFSSDDTKEAIIIFGVKGYPPLPRTFLWRKTIIIPANGIFITSDTMEELPGTFPLTERRYVRIHQYCFVNTTVFSAFYFPVCQDCASSPVIPDKKTDVQIFSRSIYDSLARGQLNGLVKRSNINVIKHDAKGLFFDVSEFSHSWNNVIPNCIVDMKIYKAVLSRHLIRHYMERIPKPILENPYIEELYLDRTNLDSLPKEISLMQNLRILDISNNQLRTIPDAIQGLPKLEVIYLFNNQFSAAEIKRIKRLLPKVLIYSD